MTVPSKPAVLVVNSLVARGGVGGRASVFALERSGFPVWSVPTLLLPWHLGHGRASRVEPDAADFGALLADLGAAPWLGEVGAVLTGYFGRADQVMPVARLVEAVKAANPKAVYLCDPIVGDSEGLFVAEALAAAIRDHLVPRADIATPNRYELHWLTGRDTQDNVGLIAAAAALGPGEVVVTSAFADHGRVGALVADRQSATLATHPERMNVPHGTGDLFAALYLGHRLLARAPADALQRAASATLRLIDLAGDLGVDEMPLAAGQEAFEEDPRDVTMARLEPAATSGGATS